MKNTTVLLLAACAMISTSLVRAETYIAEVTPAIDARSGFNRNSSVSVQILRFEHGVSDLGGKITGFNKEQISGKRFTTEEAALYFNPSSRVAREFKGDLAGASQYDGAIDGWHFNNVLAVTKSHDGRTTTTGPVSVKTGVSVFVSASQLKGDSRSQIQMRVHQLVPTSETDTSPYFGSSNARLSDREMLPMFWTNNGIQYGAFLIFEYSKSDK